MQSLEGLYTLQDLVTIQHQAQLIADAALRMSMIRLYADEPLAPCQRHQNDIQRAFSEMHSAVIGLNNTEESSKNGIPGRLYDRGDTRDFVPD